MLDVCTIEDLVICGTFELLTIHVWLIWAMTCIIMLDVHACMSERNTHTHTDIYIYIYIMTCIALHDFTRFYTYLSLYIYSTYIYSMSFTISTGHQRLRALWGLEPSIARLLRGAVDGTNSWGFQFFFGKSWGYFMGIYIYIYIYVYMYYVYDYVYMYICIMKWLFNVFNVFMGLNDHINICIWLIIWLCMYICNVIWDISCFMYIYYYIWYVYQDIIWKYVTCHQDMSQSESIQPLWVTHLCGGDGNAQNLVADSLEKYGESAF